MFINHPQIMLDLPIVVNISPSTLIKSAEIKLIILLKFYYYTKSKMTIFSRMIFEK